MTGLLAAPAATEVTGQRDSFAGVWRRRVRFELTKGFPCRFSRPVQSTLCHTSGGRTR